MLEQYKIFSFSIPVCILYTIIITFKVMLAIDFVMSKSSLKHIDKSV